MVQSDQSLISFAVAFSKDVTTEFNDYGQWVPHYRLELWETDTIFYTDRMCGTIQTNLCNHIFCIVKYTKLHGYWCQDISFSLARVDLQPSQTVHEFHFYGLFDLATNRIVSKHHV